MILVTVAVPSECVCASQAYLVSEEFGRRLWRIEDLNGDGDALDAGEQTLWADNFVGNLLGMETTVGAVYVTENGLPGGDARVVRLIDANRDGDALDEGEWSIWAEGLAAAGDVVRAEAGNWFVSDFVNHQVWQLLDQNNDGDALDIGEITLFGSGISDPFALLVQGNSLLVPSSGVNGQVHRLVDLNSDGDALDIGEIQVITPSFTNILGLLDDGSGGFYFSSLSEDTVYHASDRNGDGDMLDVAEVLSYADTVFGLLNGPRGMVSYHAGGFLLVDSLNDQIKWVRDITRDHDALDMGEVVLFASGIDGPVDIVALLSGLPGDFDFDGDVDGRDFLLWQRGRSPRPLSVADLQDWQDNYGLGTSLTTTLAVVPEPSSVAICWLLGFFLCQRRPSSH